MTDMNVDPNSEQALYRVKKHWIVLCRGILMVILIWLICTFGFTIANGIRGGAPLISVLLFLICLIVIMFTHHWLFLRFLGWELSILVITSTRVMNFENIPYIENDVNFIDIKEIEQILQIKHGFLQNVLNYGKLIINIPANQQQIIFEYLPRPDKLANIIEAIQKGRGFKSLNTGELTKFFRRKYEYILKEWCFGVEECEEKI